MTHGLCKIRLFPHTRSERFTADARHNEDGPLPAVARLLRMLLRMNGAIDIAWQLPGYAGHRKHSCNAQERTNSSPWFIALPGRESHG